MKRGGILHPALSHLLASSGHADYFTICDRGFSVPAQPERIDLALVDDIPTVLDVLKAVAAEFQIDRVLITEEMTQISRQRVEALRRLLDQIPLEVIPQQDLQRLAATAKATVRTGDTCPYANVIVVSG